MACLNSRSFAQIYLPFQSVFGPLITNASSPAWFLMSRLHVSFKCLSLQVALARLFCRIPESFDFAVTVLFVVSLRWFTRNGYDWLDLGDVSVPSRLPPLIRENVLLMTHRVLSPSFAQAGQHSFKGIERLESDASTKAQGIKLILSLIHFLSYVFKNSNLSPPCMRPHIHNPAARVPVQAWQEPPESAERFRTGTGPDACKNADVNIHIAEHDKVY